MTTAGTDQTTSKDVCYNISTGQYQSSSGLLWQITNLQKYICSRTMSGSYIYDVVWCGLEMIKNKQKQFSVTNYSSSRLLMPRGSRVLAL